MMHQVEIEGSAAKVTLYRDEIEALIRAASKEKRADMFELDLAINQLNIALIAFDVKV